jgi:hypothetical protein
MFNIYTVNHNNMTQTYKEIVEVFKIFMVAMVLMMFFWVKMPCGLAGKSQRFGEACCLHLQAFTVT